MKLCISWRRFRADSKCIMTLDCMPLAKLRPKDVSFGNLTERGHTGENPCIVHYTVIEVAMLRLSCCGSTEPAVRAYY